MIMFNLYDAVMDELNSRDVYKHEVYAPYYICSYATHAFNLMNQKKKIYWESKQLPNMRAHLLFVAPPGWMKSFYLNTMGADDHAIFKHAGIDMGSESYMTEAGFVGTFNSMDGVNLPVEGAAKTYKNGILMIDEFSAITKALQTQHSNQLDNQLLSALDHGNVQKRLGAGKIEYKTKLTLWAGVQPARFDLTSGLGRRLLYMVFIPSKYDNQMLMEARHNSRNMRPNDREMKSLWGSIKSFNKSMGKIEKVVFDDSVMKLYEELGLFSFEGSYFDRLLLGHELATRGPDKVMTISADDSGLRKLIARQKKWRGEISMGIEYVQLKRIIELNGNTITKVKLIEESAMYGWNTMQVLGLLEDMKRYRIVKISRGLIELEDEGKSTNVVPGMM
ncbi:hypothetical protein KAT92_06535 [Candidatus Babeliales bacterium]|nr:hypothetical protein [Candidatus Babeliales bacterium]